MSKPLTGGDRVGPVRRTYLDVGEEHRTEAALCEPYLRVVFPDGLPSPSAARPAQRPLAAEVARHDPAWERDIQALSHRDSHLASRVAHAWDRTFSRLHLPNDRPAWLAVAGVA